jgi:hypothetical protein
MSRSGRVNPFSVGILYSTHALLRLIGRAPLHISEFLASFPIFEIVPGELALKTAVTGRWIVVSPAGRIRLTKRGEALAAVESPIEALAIQLRDLIGALRPLWATVLARGRKEAAAYLPIDVKQALDEADLLSGRSRWVVEWWNSVSTVSAKPNESRKLEISRRAERLTIQYERRRTGIRPFWQALESDLAGYDVLSQVSRLDRAPLRIEVKGTRDKPSYAKFHLTRNEWRVAMTSRPYVFHFWLLLPSPKLFTIEPDKIAPHIAKNRGAGEWEIVEIPWKVVI